ncbi:tyrosine-type recombinase/integrase [Novosphingobium sp. KCTC 2891]|uniref:tyrosine-type recombinase/integrase n=1 Tax=Novosphingobium sp. KCTC 2891 TaxID=2989730 RepID=UPI00222291BD|nr:tyrosine-type recombinase/integrase [Novosphingobium sp. KCTC 2891]MCW1382689.1 tyrosine-type recombinase/integrase [Novosphingobium sp. KCTC 2891]
MVSIRQHRLRWKATVRVPKALERHHGTTHLYRNLTSTDRRAAKLEAETWENSLRLQWAAMSGGDSVSREVIREIYEDARRVAEAGELLLHADDERDPVTAGIEYELDKLADSIGQRELKGPEAAKVNALQDALRAVQRRPVERRREYERTFRELASAYMEAWKADASLKDTNTEQQKLATFDLFAMYWGARPLREVRKADAADFVDALRRLDPLWGRSPKAKEKVSAGKMSWAELQKAFGGRPSGLSDATVNRHMATLQSYWKWGQERDHCEGNNPFSGFHRKLKTGRNVQGYVAWAADELERLFNPPPKRSDLTEVMLVAMFTGMRLDEIASLTRGQIKTKDGVPFLHVTDAKTAAGVRYVPLHPRLEWLARRANGPAEDRIWPTFNEEGPGKKAGADAGKEFSRFKLALGFTDRRRVFHSFRKNFVGQLEERSVPQSEVAQLVGHEKGFTYGKYGAGVSLQRLAKIVALIDYPGLALPAPSVV